MTTENGPEGQVGDREGEDTVDDTEQGDDDAQGGSGGGQGEGADDGDGDKPLGPQGEKALAAEKEKRRRESTRRRQVEGELADLRAEVAKLRKGASKQDDDSAEQAEEIRRNAEVEATQKANMRILRAEVKAAAGGLLTDPADAVKFLDLAQFEADADGEFDAGEITDALKDLVKQKPYLAVPSGSKRFQGTADGGARGKQAGPSLDEQIAEAQQKGNWQRVISLNNQKLAQVAGDK